MCANRGGGSIEPVGLPGYGHAIFVLVCFPGRAEELGEVGNEKPSFDVVLNRVYLCQKNLLKSDTDSQC